MMRDAATLMALKQLPIFTLAAHLYVALRGVVPQIKRG